MNLSGAQQKRYEVIVVGSGIAGLGVGGILQKNGLSTLVLEKSKTAGGRAKTYERAGGWKVDSGTHCVDLGTHSPCAKLLAQLGQEISWSQNLQGFMFYSQGQWKPIMEYLEATTEDEIRLAELEAWIRSISDREIDRLDTVSLDSLIAEKGVSARIAEYMKTVGMIQTTLTFADAISAGEFIAIYREALKAGTDSSFPFSQVRMPKGGVANMILALERGFKERGGTLFQEARVHRLDIQNGNMFTVFSEKGAWQAPIVVVAAPIWNMVDFVPMSEIADLAPKWAERMLALRQETSASMGFTIGTSEPLFTWPCYLSAWRLPGLELPLQILGHTIFDESIAPPNHMVAFIGACCTPGQALDKKFREKTLGKFWELFREMFPLIDDKLLWKHEAYYVGIDGLSRSPGLTGRFRPSVRLAEVPGLYFAGDCYTGRGVGMNAAANSAMVCANEILSRSPSETLSA